jgi:hypothetical protein
VGRDKRGNGGRSGGRVRTEYVNVLLLCVNVLLTGVGDPPFLSHSSDCFAYEAPIHPTHSLSKKSLEKQGKAIHFCIKPLS